MCARAVNVFHHRVRLPGEERYPAAAGDGRRSGGFGGGGEDGGRGLSDFGESCTSITKNNIVNIVKASLECARCVRVLAKVYLII